MSSLHRELLGKIVNNFPTVREVDNLLMDHLGDDDYRRLRRRFPSAPPETRDALEQLVDNLLRMIDTGATSLGDQSSGALAKFDQIVEDAIKDKSRQQAMSTHCADPGVKIDLGVFQACLRFIQGNISRARQTFGNEASPALLAGIVYNAHTGYDIADDAGRRAEIIRGITDIGLRSNDIDQQDRKVALLSALSREFSQTQIVR